MFISKNRETKLFLAANCFGSDLQVGFSFDLKLAFSHLKML